MCEKSYGSIPCVFMWHSMVVIHSVRVGLVYSVVYSLLEALPGHCHWEDGMPMASTGRVRILSDTTRARCPIAASRSRSLRRTCLLLACCRDTADVAWWSDLELLRLWWGGRATWSLANDHSRFCTHACRHMVTHIVPTWQRLQVNLTAIRLVLSWVQANLWRADRGWTADRLGSRTLQRVIIVASGFHVQLLVPTSFDVVRSSAWCPWHVTHGLHWLLLCIQGIEDATSLWVWICWPFHPTAHLLLH